MTTEGEIRAAWGRGDTLPEEVEVLLERLDERTEERDNAMALAKAALLARLQEPDVREAVAKAIYDIDPIGVRDWSNAPGVNPRRLLCVRRRRPHQDRGDAEVSDTLRHTPSGVFLGHMLAIDHGIHNDTPAGAEYEKALAREIFGGECWAIGKCTCFWVTAIQTVIGLIRGQPADPLAPRRHVFDLWHVYGAEMLK